MCKAILYIHGKGGSAAEADHYRPLCPGWDVYGVEHPAAAPWESGPLILAEYRRLSAEYDQVVPIANSIGAYFTMHALQGLPVPRALFISPVLDMERLITNMMGRAGVTEEELARRQEIPTNFGERLSWRYLCYVREHPIRWQVPTAVLYAGRDSLVARDTVTAFARTTGAVLTVMEEGEHWFHTPEQLAVLDDWVRASLSGMAGPADPLEAVRRFAGQPDQPFQLHLTKGGQTRRLELRRLLPADLEVVCDFQQAVAGAIPGNERSNLFQLTSREDWAASLCRDLCAGLFAGDRLAALLCAIPAPSPDQDLLADLEETAGLPAAETLVVDCVMVGPDLRGYGVQRLLLALAEEYARSNALCRLCATVSPLNPHSYRNFEAAGYRLLATRPKYRSQRRYYLREL